VRSLALAEGGACHFLPKDDKFFDQLNNLARMLVSAAQQPSPILQTFPKFDPQRQEIEDLRKKAGSLAQDSLAILDKAFITPLDREDILALIAYMNAVIQEISELSDRLGIYPMASLYPNLAAQSRNLLEFTIQVQELMSALRKKKTLSEMAEGSMKKLQAIEVNVRKDRQEFLRELFRERSDPIELIKTMPSDSILLRINERDRDNTESHNQPKTLLGDTMPARFLHPATEKVHSERNPAWR
jgi:uncharacterized protein